MKVYRFLSIVFLLLLISLSVIINAKNSFYITNQPPLMEQPYVALPLGAIQPEGMLKKMLEIQRDGLTGHLDELYNVVCGDNNGWLGGTGDGWERGPYWIDGLTPLAYILNDELLKKKVQKWVEWSIQNQREDGYFGPRPLAEGYQKIPGTQQGMREDWWPKMVMLKVLQQYYTATNDARVLSLMTRYFGFMHKNLNEKPLGFVTWWAEQRGGDNLLIIYWLYNITKDQWLLDLANKVYKQTTPWAEWFGGDFFAKQNPYPSAHCVNVAMGVKTPAIYFQQTGDSTLLSDIKKGLKTIKNVHGVANGMYGGDEAMHGNDPTTGSEFCSAVELMYSFENIIPITGDLYYADYLEKIAYNVLPTQHDDSFSIKQYFQQANQIKLTYDNRNFFNDGYGRIVYGLLTGYPCCTANMHQGWPKFVQNLWYATSDNGLAALIYGASKVTAKVAGGEEVSMEQITDYPFSENVKIVYTSPKSVVFPLHLRVPGWCRIAEIQINGKFYKNSPGNSVVILKRAWNKNDEISLKFPMEIQSTRWVENSVAIERGPLLFALKIQEQWEKCEGIDFKEPHWEVYPKTPWNYGISSSAIRDYDFKIVQKKEFADMPWNLDNCPVSIFTKGQRIPEWKEYNNSAGRLPRSIVNSYEEEETIELIPYGCTVLRISQFPQVKKVERVKNESD